MSREGEHIEIVERSGMQGATGTAGLRTQYPGAAASVSALAAADGGIRSGGLAETSTGARVTRIRNN